MALMRTVEAPTGVPAGVYVATVKDLTEDDGQFGPQIKFVFEIEETLACDSGDPEDWVGQEKWGWCSDSLTPNTKLFKWARQILGGDFEIGDDLVLDDMIGRKVRITIGENKNGNLAITDVAAYRPAKSKQAERRPKRRQPEPEYDDFEDDEDEDF